MSLSAHSSLLSSISHGSAPHGVTMQSLRSPRLISAQRNFGRELNAATAQSQLTSSTSESVSTSGQGSLLNALYSALSASHAHNETSATANAVTHMQSGIKTADTF